jgi:hypothetical protein
MLLYTNTDRTQIQWVPSRSVASGWKTSVMLTSGRGAVPGLALGKLNVEYVAMDGTLHAVPLAGAARSG